MEEKNAKEVSMAPSEEKTQKLSYEELNQACAELSQQNAQLRDYAQKLYKQMQQMDMAYQFKRLDYLFKVIETANSNKLWQFSEEFINMAFKEIEETLTIPEEEEENEEVETRESAMANEDYANAMNLKEKEEEN